MLHKYVVFTYIPMLKFLLRIYGLDSLAATESDVEVLITLDGSKLTSNLFHLTAGMKIVD